VSPVRWEREADAGFTREVVADVVGIPDPDRITGFVVLADLGPGTRMRIVHNCESVAGLVSLLREVAAVAEVPL
jgi:hypothetical protein